MSSMRCEQAIDEIVVGSRRAGPTDAAIGARIRTIRMAARLSLEELAGRLGVSPQQLHKYETGGTRITVVRLIAVADALEVDLETLLSVSRPTAPAERGPTSADMLRLMATFYRLHNPASRAKVMELADFLRSFESSDGPT